MVVLYCDFMNYQSRGRKITNLIKVLFFVGNSIYINTQPIWRTSIKSKFLYSSIVSINFK